VRVPHLWRGPGRRGAALDGWNDPEAIRAELFGVERLEQHAESLAAAQKITASPTHRRRLTPRVHENGRVLLESYRTIAEAIHSQQVITPAAEWLVDNFHIVEDQVREIREDLPPGYYRKLPKLAAGHLEGYPRIFGLAWAFVAHTDSRFDPDVLLRFVNAYQRVQPLTIGELWAVAITLRIVLVENLRRLAVQITDAHEMRANAVDDPRLLARQVAVGYALRPEIPRHIGRCQRGDTQGRRRGGNDEDRPRGPPGVARPDSRA